MTELKSAEERMLHDAVHDNLTGLPNRELFNDRLGAAILMAQKPGGAAPTVMVIDIDEFQSVNDSYGLSIGDSALLAVARRLSRDLRPGDTLARLAATRSARSCSPSRGRWTPPRRIDALRAALAAPISFGEREITLTVSIGAAQYDPKLHGKGGDLLADAQLALANAKKAGGDRVEIFSPFMRSYRSDRQTLENDMRRALERGEISVLFRPIVRLEDRTVAGFQSLLRWRHPRLGLLDEDEFSSRSRVDRRDRRYRRLRSRGDGEGAGGVAEGARGQSADLRHRRRVVAPDAQPRSAFRRARRARPPLRAARLAQARGGGEPGDGKPGIRRRSAAAGARNRRGAMLDRFGAGYTSLGHLPQYRFDAMRIDASLVRPNSFGARSPILRSIVAMAQEIGMDVISEGAETESDAVELAQLGCQFAQGAAFGQPMSAAAARKLMGAAGGLTARNQSELGRSRREANGFAAPCRKSREAGRRRTARRAPCADDKAPDTAPGRSGASLRDEAAPASPIDARWTVVPPVSRETSRTGEGEATSTGWPVTQVICRSVSTGRSKGRVRSSRRSAAARETICPIARSGGASGRSKARAPRRATAAPLRIGLAGNNT